MNRSRPPPWIAIAALGASLASQSAPSRPASRAATYYAQVRDSGILLNGRPAGRCTIVLKVVGDQVFQVSPTHLADLGTEGALPLAARGAGYLVGTLEVRDGAGTLRYLGGGRGPHAIWLAGGAEAKTPSSGISWPVAVVAGTGDLEVRDRLAKPTLLEKLDSAAVAAQEREGRAFVARFLGTPWRVASRTRVSDENSAIDPKEIAPGLLETGFRDAGGTGRRRRPSSFPVVTGLEGSGDGRLRLSWADGDAEETVSVAFLYDPFARVLSIEAPWEEQDDKDNDVFHRPVLRYRVTETTQGELVLRSASALRLDTDAATKKQVGWFVANEYRLVPVPKRAPIRK